ncbi:hypothetical protein LY78DRAFT_497398 [Colletotrichum sublineola]|nr:hypothetical protein LY78DRAFT_497398 [Colletotrichum sublineola]
MGGKAKMERQDQGSWRERERERERDRAVGKMTAQAREGGIMRGGLFRQGFLYPPALRPGAWGGFSARWKRARISDVTSVGKTLKKSFLFFFFVWDEKCWALACPCEMTGEMLPCPLPFPSLWTNASWRDELGSRVNRDIAGHCCFLSFPFMPVIAEIGQHHHSCRPADEARQGVGDGSGSFRPLSMERGCSNTHIVYRH